MHEILDMKVPQLICYALLAIPAWYVFGIILNLLINGLLQLSLIILTILIFRQLLVG